MRLAWLEATGFRTYADLRFEPGPRVNVLVGPNGAGKTNLLEAIAYLARLGSFRRAADDVLIADGADSAVLRGVIDHGDRESLIEVELSRERRRRVQVNRARPARTDDLLDHVRAVVFQPDDLDIAKRSPSYRRDFLDEVAGDLWVGARADQADYERALRHRNALLKQMGPRADPTTLAVWNERLSATGARVMARRADALALINDVVSEAYGTLAGESVVVSADYRSTWGGMPTRSGPEDWQARLWAALEEVEQTDKERRLTSVGPHRDDPGWLIDGRDSRLHASQGEQRTLVLALRLAQQAAIARVTAVPPLLLLDDVFSELDRNRAAALAGALPATQTFITTAREDEVSVQGVRWSVETGSVGGGAA